MGIGVHLYSAWGIGQGVVSNWLCITCYTHIYIYMCVRMNVCHSVMSLSISFYLNSFHLNSRVLLFCLFVPFLFSSHLRRRGMSKQLHGAQPPAMLNYNSHFGSQYRACHRAWSEHRAGCEACGTCRAC